MANGRKKHNARLREFDAAIAATKQRHAEMGFECFDLSTDGAMGEMELTGSRGEAQAVGGDLERRQGFKRRQAAAHEVFA